MTEHIRADADAPAIRADGAAGVSGVVVGAATDVGRLRTVNEDGYLAIAPAFVVVDGMGGHAAGRMATQVALDALYSLAGTRVTSVETVVHAVMSAQEAIVSIPSHAAYLPGATIAGVILAWLEDEQGVARPTWIIFNIGDARVYLLREGMLSQVTRDHSRVQILVETGELTPEQARSDPRRNVVTRALGGGIADSAVPDLYSVPVAAGDRLLVCSDGLSGVVSDTEIGEVARYMEDSNETAQTLVQKALGAGGSDNVTVLVVDIVDCSPRWPALEVEGETATCDRRNVGDDTVPRKGD